MKKTLFAVFLFSIAIFSNACHCVDENEWMNQGEITGYDYRECACCGGYWIAIESDTFRFYEIPTDSDVTISSTTEFPILVNVNWHLQPDGCMGDEIIVEQMEYR